MMVKVESVVVMVVVLAVITPTVIGISVFSALRRGFEKQEEIQYSSLRSSNGYQVRQYPAKKWVCSQQTSADSDQMAVFLRLFAYIDGDNDRNSKLVMGLPVSITARGVVGDRTLEGCFFIPESNQANPPVPTDSSVFITTRPATTIFTKRFGGYANDESTWEDETRALRRLVEGAGEVVDPALAYWNAYDSPLKLWNRRNEVWLVQANEPAQVLA